MSTTTIHDTELFEELDKLNRDLKDASRLLGRREARYLVDMYYAIQDFRTQAAGQIRSAETEEPNRVLEWVFVSTRRLEHNIKRSLGEFASEYLAGQWAQSIMGIGPVISAGLLAHIDIRMCKTAGQIWRFAGLDPTVKWEKKTKRPWNAKLKVLCWKLGESFVKVHNNKKDYYGKIYVSRKEREIEMNDRGEYADQAREKLENYRIGKDTQAYIHYSSGALPPGHIHERAKRYAVKMFLSHLHEVMYRDYFNEAPPVPYSFEHSEGNHRHFVDVPNQPFDGDGKGLKELFDA